MATRNIFHFNRSITLTSLCLSLLICSIGTSEAAITTATDPLVINNNHPEGSPAEIWMTKVYRDLYERINVPLKMVYFPKARGAFYADTGKIDGQVTSVFQYQDKQKEQIRINFPLVKLSMLAITQNNKNIEVQNWDSLNNTRFRVEYVRGILLAEKELTKRVSKGNLTDSSSAMHSLQKVKHDRIDIFVHGNITLFPLTHSADFSNELISAGALSTNTLYPYLNRAHKELVPIIEKTLHEMRVDGSIFNYCVEAYGIGSEEFCNSVSYNE
ncbi:hypothetical protein [Vibrio sp. HN007]|uniref:hypothetical protein n=1 Tax=Vibrio iocasae TaxID=3098914 RepID=UPI0035D466DD